jgi:hypothetical protein
MADAGAGPAERNLDANSAMEIVVAIEKFTAMKASKHQRKA